MSKTGKPFETSKVLTISIAHFVHDVYSSFLAPILPLIIEKLSISYSAAAALTLVQRIPSLLNPLIGIIADKVSIRYLLIIAPSITVVSMSLLGFAPTYSFLLVLLFFMGIGSALFHVPAPVMVKKVSGDRVGLGMSFFMVGGEGARGVAPLIIVGAVDLWGLEGTFRLIPFGLTASLLLFLKFRNIKISEDLKKKKESGAFSAFKAHYKFFKIIIVIMFFQTLFRSGITAFLPTYITSDSGDLWLGTIALSVFQGAGAFGTLAFGALSDKMGRRRILLFIAAISPFFLIGFIFAPPVLGIILLLILGFIIFGSQPIMMAIVNELKSERPAFLNGIYFTINFITSGIAVLLAGALADFMGFRNMYLITAVCSFVTIYFIYRLPIARRN